MYAVKITDGEVQGQCSKLNRLNSVKSSDGFLIYGG